MKPGPNHPRAIRARLTHLDKGLATILRAAVEGERGELYQVIPLPDDRAAAIASEVADARRRIGRLASHFQMDPEVLPAEQVIMGTNSLLWETVVEIHGRYLEGYGRVPADLGRLLDSEAAALEDVLDRIERIVLGRHNWADEPSSPPENE